MWLKPHWWARQRVVRRRRVWLSSWSTQWLPTFVLSRDALLNSKLTFSGLSPPGGRGSICWVRSPELRVIGIWVGRGRVVSSTWAFILLLKKDILPVPKAHSLALPLCLLSGVPPPPSPRVQCSGLIYTCHSPPLVEPTRVSRRGMPPTTGQHSPQTISYPPFKKPPQTLSATREWIVVWVFPSFLQFPLITLVILFFPPKL